MLNLYCFDTTLVAQLIPRGVYPNAAGEKRSMTHVLSYDLLVYKLFNYKQDILWEETGGHSGQSCFKLFLFFILTIWSNLNGKFSWLEQNCTSLPKMLYNMDHMHSSLVFLQGMTTNICANWWFSIWEEKLITFHFINLEHAMRPGK